MSGLLHKRAVIFLAAAVILTGLLPFLFRSVNDGDFYWHLKTGEWIAQHHALPQQDPFSFAVSSGDDARRHFLLTSYWLSQVLYYAAAKAAGGLGGIVLLRFLIVAALGVALLRRRHGDMFLYLGLVSVFLTQMLSAFPLDRPQVLSFLCFALLLLLIERQRETPAKNRVAAMALPGLLMLVWANLHGGHAVGQAVIGLVLLAEGVKRFSPSLGPLDNTQYRQLFITGIVGIALSFVNPNTWHALPMVFNTPASVQAGNMEYQSSLSAFMTFNDPRIILYWAVLGLAALSLLITGRKTDITGALLLACLAFVSFRSIRYIPFFMIAAIPLISRAFSSLKMLSLVRIVFLAAGLASLAFFSWKDRYNLANAREQRWVNTYNFPVTAADFLVQRNIRGNIFNPLEWGGYLIWRLAPGSRVFVDGRTLYPAILDEARLIQAGHDEYSDGLPYWKRKLRDSGTTCAVLPLIPVSGDFPQLAATLLKDTEWEPVFLDANAMIFVRSVPENQEILRTSAIPKDSFERALSDTLQRVVMARPSFVQGYIALSDFSLYMGRFQEARYWYMRTLEIAPYNEKARQMMGLLQSMGK